MHHHSQPHTRNMKHMMWKPPTCTPTHKHTCDQLVQTLRELRLSNMVSPLSRKKKLHMASQFLWCKGDDWHAVCTCDSYAWTVQWGGAGVSQSLSFQFTSRSLTQHWDIQTVGGIRGNRLVCVCARVFVYVCVRVCAQVQRERMCMGL